MAELIANDKLKVVVGLGATGLSVARHLAAAGERFVVLDTRQQPPALKVFSEEFPDVVLELGPLDVESLLCADEIVMSPGLATSDPVFDQVKVQGIPLIGDIELFARAAKAPIVAITGSNGKSTVTTLVGEMCREAGMNAGVGGNLGTPALDLLADDRDIYVIELSSFQLELVNELKAEVAVVLNVSPDHMDRYTSMIQYHQAKHRIFRGASQVAVNKDEPLSHPLLSEGVKGTLFGLKQPDLNDFGLIKKEQGSWLALGVKPLLPVSELGMKGRHNVSNALAALALGSAAGLSMDVMLPVLTRFKGLAHRCENVTVIDGVTYINDSKATNIGATMAAISGLADGANIILLAGGQGKGQDFSPLAKDAQGRVKQALLFGEDAAELAAVLEPVAAVTTVDNLALAVQQAASVAQSGDVVLLSPACASFDQFSGFAERGEAFIQSVELLS